MIQFVLNEDVAVRVKALPVRAAQAFGGALGQGWAEALADDAAEGRHRLEEINSAAALRRGLSKMPPKPPGG